MRAHCRTVSEVASEAVELREEGGFEGLKLRLGRERLADDLATIEGVREAIGSETSLMVDFNQGLHLGEALERCHAIDDLGLAWIEEPIVYDNLEGYARLTADLKTPVQIGENFYGPRALYTALQMKACDYVMPDFMRIGGVTGWQRAAAIAVQLAEAAHRVGRDPAKIEVTSLLPTSVGDTREAALATLRPGLALYAGFFPRYNRMMAAHGYPVEAAAIAEAWARQPRSDRACPCRSCLSRGTESLRTRRWREMDLNFRFRAKIYRQPAAWQHREKGPNASFTSHPRLVPHHRRKPFARRSADAARKRSSRIGTKLLPRRPVLCTKCRPHGANLTRRAEWF